MRGKNKTKNMVMMALMAAVMAVLSPMSIPIGPVPLTLGVFAVCLAGAVLPTAPALVSLSVYLFLGAVGLPVFSSYRGGLQMLVGATGGYLFGYYFLVLALSVAVAKTKRPVVRYGIGLLGLAGFYLLGTVWYAVVMSVSVWAAFLACVAPFAVPDMLKMAAALALAEVLERRMGRAAP